MKKKLKILFFFAVFFLIFSSHFYSQEKPALFVWIYPATEVKLKELILIPDRKIASPTELIGELTERYNEVWAADKSQWPECIRKVFENLKENEIIVIKWKLDGRLQKSYYQGDYDADGSFTFGYSMDIKNVYAEKFHESDHAIEKANLDKKRINTNMWFKTSGVLLHEMIHMALKRNQDYKEVRNSKGEVSELL
jgi:hypothetical protein